MNSLMPRLPLSHFRATNALLLALVFITVPAGREALATVVPAGAKSSTLSDFLTRFDLVGTGEVLEIQRGHLGVREGTCDSPGGGFNRFSCLISIDELFAGNVSDPSVTILSPFAHNMPGLEAGARVLFWATRSGHDQWRFQGSVLVQDEDGCLRGDQNNALTEERAQFGDCVGIQQVKDRAESRRSKTAFFQYDQVEYLALVTIAPAIPARDPGRSVRYELLFLNWIAGHAENTPQILEVADSLQCFAVSAGDTLLLPIPSGADPTLVSVATCPQRLMVHCGFVPILGVELNEAVHAFVREGNVLRVRNAWGNTDD